MNSQVNLSETDHVQWCKYGKYFGVVLANKNNRKQVVYSTPYGDRSFDYVTKNPMVCKNVVSATHVFEFKRSYFTTLSFFTYRAKNYTGWKN